MASPAKYICVRAFDSSRSISDHQGMSKVRAEDADGDRRRLANYVRARRHALGWHNTRDFAEAAGVSTATISAIETGKNVRANSVAMVEIALGWRPGSAEAVLLGGEPVTDDAPAPAPEKPVTASEVRRLVDMLLDEYEDPETPEPRRLMIRGTLTMLAQPVDQNDRAGHGRDRTSA